MSIADGFLKDTYTMMLETDKAIMTHEDLNKVSGSNLDTSDIKSTKFVFI